MRHGRGMPGYAGMEVLKAEALKQGRWRLGEDGYIEKGPFPKERTSVNVSLLDSNTESGKSILRLTPRNAGDSPIIYYSTKKAVSESDSQVEDLEYFITGEGTLLFFGQGRYWNVRKWRPHSLDSRPQDTPRSSTFGRQAAWSPCSVHRRLNLTTP